MKNMERIRYYFVSFGYTIPSNSFGKDFVHLIWSFVFIIKL